MSDALGFLGKIVHVIVDRPMNSKHSDFELVYSVNYGYVPNTVSIDGEELDAYILGVFSSRPKLVISNRCARLTCEQCFF